MPGTAFAQTGQEGPPAALNIGFFLVIGVVFYLLLLRPEQKRRRDHEKLLAALKRNDQVVMASGIHGRVTGLGEKVLTVEIAPKVQIQVDRSAVQGVQKPTAVEAREKEREKS